MVSIPGGRRLKRPKRKSIAPKLRNETQYKGCRVQLNKFLSNPSKKTYQAYKKAYDKLLGVNPSQAKVFRNTFKQYLFDKALSEEKFQ